jgi:hypothetical protein
LSTPLYYSSTKGEFMQLKKESRCGDKGDKGDKGEGGDKGDKGKFVSRNNLPPATHLTDR